MKGTKMNEMTQKLVNLLNDSEETFSPYQVAKLASKVTGRNLPGPYAYREAKAGRLVTFKDEDGSLQVTGPRAAEWIVKVSTGGRGPSKVAAILQALGE
jgi:hypothetical protein